MHRSPPYPILIVFLLSLLFGAASNGSESAEQLLEADFYNSLERAAQYGVQARGLERAGREHPALDAYLEACELLEQALTRVFHRNWPVTRLPWNALMMVGTAHMDAARLLLRMEDSHSAAFTHLEAAEKAYGNLLFREQRLNRRDARHAPPKVLAQAHFEQGNIHLFHEQYRQARRAYRRALDLDPGHRAARHRLQSLSCHYESDCGSPLHRSPSYPAPNAPQATQINIILAPLERGGEGLEIYQQVLQTTH